jgi:hypothetical protein
VRRPVRGERQADTHLVRPAVHDVLPVHLRGPLQIISSFTKTMLDEDDEPLSERARHRVRRIRAAADRRAALVESLLILPGPAGASCAGNGSTCPRRPARWLPRWPPGSPAATPSS